MIVGYARVSTADQTLALQLALQKDALEQAGCERISTDTTSGAKAERPGLDEALAFLRPGDALVVWRLDRLGRSLQHLIELLNWLDERQIGFRSITEQIDTTTSGGKLIFHIFGALAEFEWDLIRERTRAGLAAARARGRNGGRRRLLDSAQKVAMAQALYDDKRHSIAEICREWQRIRRCQLQIRKQRRPLGSSSTHPGCHTSFLSETLQSIAS
ncbi:MAG: recombinase family protein [Chloroflexi bacterium]|nr:recombinase family protein [Chloroflexota bacterium]